MPTPRLTDAQLDEVVRAVWTAGGNQTVAAAALDIPRGTLQARMCEARRRGRDQIDDPKLIAECRDEALLRFASQRQAEIMRTVAGSATLPDAASALRMDQASIRRSVCAVRAAAARKGYSPEHGWSHSVPPTHIARGVSTYYGQDGSVRGQWVKADLDRVAAYEAIKAAALALAEDVPPANPIPAPAVTRANLLNVVTITDAHVGMLSWPRETGQAWDLEIAERTLVGCFEAMVKGAPRARVAYINQLGDFLHSDGMQAVTPTNGHLLDQDGRFARVARIAVRVLRRVVDLCLAHHEQIYVLLAEGNHDLASSIWLRVMFQALYENEPRVHVVDSEFPYYAHQHGETMVAFHHGHLKKNDQLPGLFASAFAPMWGETRKRYCHTGHKHHTDEKEYSGMVVMQHPTLAARDAYAARGGWFAMRRASVVTYHDRYGEVSRYTVCPEMLEEAG